MFPLLHTLAGGTFRVVVATLQGSWRESASEGKGWGLPAQGLAGTVTAVREGSIP